MNETHIHYNKCTCFEGTQPQGTMAVTWRRFDYRV